MRSLVPVALMQRIASLASRRELGGFGAGACAWKRRQSGCTQPVVHRQWAGVCAQPARPFAWSPGTQGQRRFVFAGQKHRLFSSKPGAKDRAGISVIGCPDPITWIRCKTMKFLISLYFETDVISAEFDRGVKQALVFVSDVMSRGRYHELVGTVSNEMIEYVEEKCKPLTKAQRKQLAVKLDDIIFLSPDDVFVVADQYGRMFCFIVMRFWFLSTHEGPDDPEAAKIFKVAPNEDGSPQRKIATAVYEFRRELTKGAYPDWTVTLVWHWHWKLAE